MHVCPQPHTGATAIMLACRNGHAKCVKQLLKAGSPVTSQTISGLATPLHFACRFGFQE